MVNGTYVFTFGTLPFGLFCQIWTHRIFRHILGLILVIFEICHFLGGLSLYLNHLMGSPAANYDWPFGTLPFGLFGSNLVTKDLETYPRTYSGHFLKYVKFWQFQGHLSTFQKMGGLRKSKFSRWRSDCYPLISLVLGGEVPRLNHGPICFPIQNTKGGDMGHQKSSTTFLTLSWRIKAHLLLMYCIKNLSIGVS